MSPYRHAAPRLPDPRPTRSTLRRLARVGDRSCRLYLPFRFRWRRVPRKVGTYAMSAALYLPPAALVQAWPAWAMWPLLFAFGLAAWAVVDVAMGYLRLRRVRRTLRIAAAAERTPDGLVFRRVYRRAGMLTMAQLVPAREAEHCRTCGATDEEHCDAARHS